MSVRAGMANLLLRLRSLTDAGQTDYVVDGVTYFTDQQLQDELDAVVQVYREWRLDPLPQHNGSAYIYKEFSVPAVIPLALEEDGAGTGGWAVRDGNGNAKTITTDYTVNYRNGVITFVADQVANPNFTLDCRAYDLNQAAAAIWRQKGAFEYRAMDWSSNSVSFKSSQRYEHCLERAQFFEAKAGMTVTQAVRTDEL